MFEKILIANRGEIALRIHRALQRNGYIYGSGALLLLMQMRCTCGSPTKAYAWDQHRLRTVILISQPSYQQLRSLVPMQFILDMGFCRREASFASILEEHGFTFIGPSAEHIKLMGDKVAAKAAVEENVPVVPGSKGALETAADARRSADQIGYPVLIKAAGGGGGRGMQVVHKADEVEEAYRLARTEAKASFKNDAVYMEKFLGKPRHIEVQVFLTVRGSGAPGGA